MAHSQLSRLFHSPTKGFFAVTLAALLLFPAISNAQEVELIGPLRLTVAPPGLLVGDYVGSQVLIVDPATLEITSALPIYTDETLQVRGKPLSVGWMNHHLYVGEELTGLIQVFTQDDGEMIRARYRGEKKTRWIQLSASLTTTPVVQPSAIVTDESLGLLFVASKGEKAVLVLNETGNLIRTIGPGSTAPLGNPQSIALDRDGQRVFVSDDGIEKCGMMG